MLVFSVERYLIKLQSNQSNKVKVSKVVSNKFWQTVGTDGTEGKGKQGLVQAVFSRGKELLTLTGDTVE